MIFSGKQFQVYSFGNGLHYEVKRLSDRKTLYLQGDDATQFRDDWNRAERKNPTRRTDDIIAALTDEHTFD